MAACAWNLREWLVATTIFLFLQKVRYFFRDLCINMNNHQKSTFHLLGDFLNPALALLGQGLRKSPICQKLNFANHPYLCEGLFYKESLVYVAVCKSL
ncbi:Mobile element protein [uncultured Candidatus Thioglobus sp.]|nr:Mobile element protein [uncultured Candidatus Thioglobus sp.]